VCFTTKILTKSIKQLLRYCNFQDGGRPPSWIYLPRLWTTQEEYLVVFTGAKFDWNPCSSFDNMKV